MRFFSKTIDKLKGALRKTAQVLNTDVRTLFIPGRQIDDAFLDETEEKLIRADLGVGNVTKIIAEIRDRWRLGKIRNQEEAGQIFREELLKGWGPPESREVSFVASRPTVVMVDTAGRLHTQDHLMRELTKIRDVVAKRIEGAPHEVLLVLDATTGQNAIAQAKNFSKAVNVTGIMLAKLDGTAKGGVVLAIRDQLNIPVKFIGLGETPQDIETFDPA